MTFIDRPLPEALVLPMLREPKPHDKRLDNLQHEGRAKGLANKITRDLRNGIVDAAINVGRDGHGTDGLVGFLEDLAANHKKMFTSLLVRVLPMQLNADVATHTGWPINILSIPSGVHFKAEVLADTQEFHTIQADALMKEPERYLDFSHEQIEGSAKPEQLAVPGGLIEQGAPEEALAELVSSIKYLARQVGVPIDDL